MKDTTLYYIAILVALVIFYKYFCTCSKEGFDNQKIAKLMGRPGYGDSFINVLGPRARPAKEVRYVLSMWRNGKSIKGSNRKMYGLRDAIKVNGHPLFAQMFSSIIPQGPLPPSSSLKEVIEYALKNEQGVLDGTLKDNAPMILPAYAQLILLVNVFISPGFTNILNTILA